MDSDQYISESDPSFQNKLISIRSLVHGSDPRVQENMRGDFIYFTIDGVDFCALKAQKHYVSLYVFKHAILKKYLKELEGINHGVSCLRFSKTKDVPEELLSDILYQSAQQF